MLSGGPLGFCRPMKGKESKKYGGDDMHEYSDYTRGNRSWDKEGMPALREGLMAQVPKAGLGHSGELEFLCERREGSGGEKDDGKGSCSGKKFQGQEGLQGQET